MYVSSRIAATGMVHTGLATDKQAQTTAQVSESRKLNWYYYHPLLIL